MLKHMFILRWLWPTFVLILITCKSEFYESSEYAETCSKVFDVVDVYIFDCTFFQVYVEFVFCSCKAVLKEPSEPYYLVWSMEYFCDSGIRI
jgi:hypothetical protein